MIRRIVDSIKKRLIAVLKTERDPRKLATSFAVGVFLAFSPYLGVQTLLIFLVGALMTLNIPVVFTVVYVINNPWTMIPIILLDYFVGQYVTRLFNWNLAQYNPSWMTWVNSMLQSKLAPYMEKFGGMPELSFWTYFIGGHIVAILAAAIAYPLAKIFFARLINSTSNNEES